MKIGSIGLGIMGKPMAKNPLKAGYNLTVNDLNQASVDKIVATGTKAAANAEIDETCDAVLTMVPNSPRVKTIVLGENGMTVHMKPGSVFIDMNSINLVASKEITAKLAERGIKVLDTPVSGDEPKAVGGTLSFMVDGKKEVFGQYKDILGAMGVSMIRCSDVGAGNTTELANQIVMACNIQALSEALTLAEIAGVDPKLVFQTIRGDLAGSTVVNAKAPVMIEGNNKLGFKIDLHTKDLNNALDCTHTVGSPLPTATAVQEIFPWSHNNDYGQDDHSSIIKYYKGLTGIKSL